MTEFVWLTNGISNKKATEARKADWQDMHTSFKANFQLSSAYEISFTLTYTEQYKDAFNLVKEKRYVNYRGHDYLIQQVEAKHDENGLATLQVTATHRLIDAMKDIVLYSTIPTEGNPEVSGGSDSDSGDGDSGDPQPGIVTKQTAVQQTYPLNERLDHFFNPNEWGITYKLHGNFPQAAVDCTGSLYEWLNSNLKLFGAYWKPDSDMIVGIYDLESLKKPTNKVFRYLHDMSNVDIQSDATNLINDVWVYGGKMEKDITSVLGPGGQTNGATEPQNGDWTPVIQNAASLIGETLSDADIVNIKNRIRIESNGNETIQNNWDSNAQAGHPSIGLVQFIQSTFDYYCRPPYTNIRKGLDQLIAMMNIPNWRQQIAGSGGWSPHGAPISKATITVNQVDNSWGWPFPNVGEGHFLGGQLFGVNPGGEFRRNGFHNGLDFGSIDHPGNEVHAIHSGQVKTISWGNGGIGFYVVIQDSSGLNVEYQEAFSNQSNITVRVGQQVKTGDVIGYRTTNHLHVGITKHNFPEAFSHAFSNDGTWIDPLSTIKTGIANGGSAPTSGSDGESTTSTTSETYYSLVYHFENQESIDKYGRRKGAPITVDSIYDLDALKKYAENTVQYNPDTTLTISDFTGEAELGEVIRLIVPERNLNTDVTLVGVSGNSDYFDPNGVKELTFNNTGLAMKDVNVAIMKDLHDINTGTPQLNYYGATGGREEDHWANIKFNDKQMDYLKSVTKAGGEIKKDGNKH